MAKNMMEHTREMLRRAREEKGLTRLRIAEDTGLSVHWLDKFAQGVLNDPTWSRLSTLHDYLIGKKVKV